MLWPIDFSKKHKKQLFFCVSISRFHFFKNSKNRALYYNNSNKNHSKWHFWSKIFHKNSKNCILLSPKTSLPNVRTFLIHNDFKIFQIKNRFYQEIFWTQNFCLAIFHSTIKQKLSSTFQKTNLWENISIFVFKKKTTKVILKKTDHSNSPHTR